MARTERVVTLLLSIPANLPEERARAEAIVAEVNRGAGKDAGVRLEFVEADSVSDGTPEFDIFVGVLWHRHGTTLQSPGSGSPEEFETARERIGKSNGLTGHFYFSDVPIPPALLDPSEIGRVLSLRCMLGTHATGFADVDHLAALMRLDLVNEVAIWRARLGSGEQPAEIPARLGPVDLSRERTAIEERFGAATEVAKGISEAARILTDTIATRQQELAQLSERMGGRPNLRLVQQVADGFRDDLEAFRRNAKVALPILGDSLREGVEIASRLVAAQAAARGTPEREALAVVPLVVGSVLAALEKALGPMMTLREVLSGLPMVRPDIAGERSRATHALEKVLAEVRSRSTILRTLALPMRIGAGASEQISKRQPSAPARSTLQPIVAPETRSPPSRATAAPSAALTMSPLDDADTVVPSPATTLATLLSGVKTAEPSPTSTLATLLGRDGRPEEVHGSNPRTPKEPAAER